MSDDDQISGSDRESEYRDHLLRRLAEDDASGTRSEINASGKESHSRSRGFVKLAIGAVCAVSILAIGIGTFSLVQQGSAEGTPSQEETSYYNVAAVIKDTTPQDLGLPDVFGHAKHVSCLQSPLLRAGDNATCVILFNTNRALITVNVISVTHNKPSIKLVKGTSIRMASASDDLKINIPGGLIGPYATNTSGSKAKAAFGTPSSSHSGGDLCAFNWSKWGLKLVFFNSHRGACKLESMTPRRNHWCGATMTKRSWTTHEGLQVGDPDILIRILYTRATEDSSYTWTLRVDGEPKLEAVTSEGTVISLIANYCPS